MEFAALQPWIWISLLAAAFQTVRFMLQKHLATATLSAGGATFSRFFYSAPFILLLLAGYVAARGVELPGVSLRFWGYGVIGGAAQIAATIFLVMLFKQRNFAVGITYAKTEIILTVLVGWLVLGDSVKPLELVAIVIGIVGVVLLSAGSGVAGRGIKDLANRAAGLGLASGLLFAISAVSYRGASLQVDSVDPFLRASITLATVVCMQTAMMVVWLSLREPGEMARVWSARRVAVWIGLTSMGGSLCWFIAFTLQNAAYVKAIGQVELIFGILASTLFFKEKTTPREWAGMGVLTCSILMLVSLL